MEPRSGGDRKRVAVKVEKEKADALYYEYKCYKKLGVVNRSDFIERPDCLATVFYFKEKVMIGKIPVNVMFMQLLGDDLYTYVVEKKVKFTLKEVLEAGYDVVIFCY